MKNILKISVLFTLLISGYGVTSSQGLVARIDSVRKEISAAMVARDTNKLFSFYTTDAISMPNYSKIAEGIENIKKSNAEMTSNAKITTYGTTTIKMITCGSIITEIGTYRINVQMQGQPQTIEDKGKYLTVWEKQKDNSLKIKIEIWNTDKYPLHDSTMMK